MAVRRAPNVGDTGASGGRLAASLRALAAPATREGQRALHLIWRTYLIEGSVSITELYEADCTEFWHGDMRREF